MSTSGEESQSSDERRNFRNARRLDIAMATLFSLGMSFLFGGILVDKFLPTAIGVAALAPVLYLAWSGKFLLAAMESGYLAHRRRRPDAAKAQGAQRPGDISARDFLRMAGFLVVIGGGTAVVVAIWGG